MIQGAGPPPCLNRTELCRGVAAAFTSRPGGFSGGEFSTLNLSWLVGDDPGAVDANRELVLRGLGAGPSAVAWLRQVHGADVVYAGDPPIADQEADAMYTDSPAVALAIMVADCAPVLLADPGAGLVGAAHAGRPGMAAGIAPALVAAMAEAGADPARMRALIGPAICGQCYEVPERMRDEVAALVPGSACVTRAGTPGLDLRAGLRGQLAKAGVGQVTDDARCTAESAELYSYRRDGRTGRFAGLIWLTA
ncbi:MAG TPA: peptidoglycan editing factor PgeF [Streptosporangiaceae bacterium]|nr:peptidoglycan editing factor PgeF [Streptosporangiaceae bacterium]